MSIPDFVQERINMITNRTKISPDEIRKDYEEIYNDDFIQKDPQFASDEERYRYAVMVLWTRYIARPQPVVSHNQKRSEPHSQGAFATSAAHRAENGAEERPAIVSRGDETHKRRCEKCLE